LAAVAALPDEPAPAEATASTAAEESATTSEESEAPAGKPKRQLPPYLRIVK
jgi:hypothetical protein